MINETFNSLQEAKERAMQLLWDERPQDSEGATITTTTSDVWDKSLKKPYRMTIEGSEAFALIMHNEYTSPKGVKTEYAYLTYVGANDKITYPFRNIEKYDLLFLLMAMFSYIPTYIKPSERITAKEAATAAGEEKIRHFFGTNYSDFMEQPALLEAIRKGEKEVFRATAGDDEEEDAGLIAEKIYPARLSEAVGKPVRNIKEYYAGLESLIGRSLNDKEKEELSFNYYFNQVELFGLYCLYCFLLTEKYSDLKEAEKDYALFGLPKGWQKNARTNFGDGIVEPYEPMEEAVLSRYFNMHDFKNLYPIELRDIAEYTGAPLRTICEAMGENEFMRRIRRNLKRK